MHTLQFWQHILCKFLIRSSKPESADPYQRFLRTNKYSQILHISAAIVVEQLGSIFELTILFKLPEVAYFTSTSRLLYLVSKSMPATRSSTRLAELATSAGAQATDSDNERGTSRKRKPKSTLVKENKKKLSKRDEDRVIAPTIAHQVPTASTSDTDSKFVPAVLSFNYEEAKKHLIEVDHRFEDLFRKMKCKPFEQLEQVHPFRYEPPLSTYASSNAIGYLPAPLPHLFCEHSDFRLVHTES